MTSGLSVLYPMFPGQLTSLHRKDVSGIEDCRTGGRRGGASTKQTVDKGVLGTVE